MTDNEKNFRQMLEDILKKLNTVFLSEADFQFTLAWKIKKGLNGNGEVILEYPEPIEDENRNVYYDIYVEDEKGNKHLIELKYRTKEATITRHGIEFKLKNQSAHDLGRYHFIADIARLEKQKISTGSSYCLMLTNDAAYKAGVTGDTNDRDFRFGDSIPGDKELDWKDKSKEYCKNLDCIKLKRDYKIEWHDYKLTGNSDVKFQYLLLEIPNN